MGGGEEDRICRGGYQPVTVFPLDNIGYDGRAPRSLSTAVAISYYTGISFSLLVSKTDTIMPYSIHVRFVYCPVLWKHSTDNPTALSSTISSAPGSMLAYTRLLCHPCVCLPGPRQIRKGRRFWTLEFKRNRITLYKFLARKIIDVVILNRNNIIKSCIKIFGVNKMNYQ